MASTTAARPESKTAKKRKAKAEVALASADSASHASDASPAVSKETAAANGDSESPYIKDLVKYDLDTKKV